MQIHGDPEAADIVFTSRADTIAVGINITTQVGFTGLVIDTLICFKSSSGVNYTHHVRFCCFRWGPSGAKKLEREACTVLVWYGQVLKGLACQVWWFPRYMKIICFCYAFSKYPRIWKKNHMLIFSYITFVLWNADTSQNSRTGIGYRYCSDTLGYISETYLNYLNSKEDQILIG